MKTFHRRKRAISRVPRSHTSSRSAVTPTTVGAHVAPLRVLFATDLSAGCARAEAALGQLARACAVVVDVVHVVSPHQVSHDVIERFALAATDAGPARVTRRMIVDSDAATAIVRMCQQEAYDLAMIPSTGSRWHLTWGDSVRSAVLRHSRTPLWTEGCRLDSSWFHRPIRRIGCHVTLEPGRDVHLEPSAELAARLGATLHVLHVVPPLDDGIIAEAFASQRPLTSNAARSRLEEMLAPELETAVTVAVGSRRGELRRWLRTHEIDLLCVGPDEAMWGNGMSPVLQKLPCPVVCIGGAPERGLDRTWWQTLTGTHPRRSEPTLAVV